MASTSPDAPNTDDSAGAVDTFVFDVTAGKPQGVADARGGQGRIDPPVTGGEAVVEPVDALPLDLPVAAPRRRPARRAVAARRRSFPAWSTSVGLHGLFLALVALATVAQRPRLQELDLVYAEGPDQLEFSDPIKNTPPPSDLEQFEDEPAGGIAIPGELLTTGDGGAAPLGPLSDFANLVGTEGEPAPGAGVGTFGEVGGMFGQGDGTGGGIGSGHGLGPAPLARFFGAEIEGRRIVFVLDNSGSMQDGRLETVIEELKRCVDSLADDQEFYVIFYSDMAYPLFYPQGANQYVRPTPRIKQKLAEWLDTVELCLGDAVVEALSAAAAIEPDVVLLLSDGRIQGTRKMSFLLDAGARNFPIHTIGVGLGRGAAASRRNLQEVAAANGGELREAEVPDSMRQLARTRPRPYHADTPGEVWGRQVKTGWGR